MTTEVYCTVLIEGTHCWPDCPFEEVAYLRDEHRHVFYVRAYKTVSHSDRDVEFIMLKHQITNYVYARYWDTTTQLHVFGSRSCEMLASELIKEFHLSKCDVSEDNENGAVVTADSTP
jgi:predicted RNA-binding protein with PIN domain